jgi:hypothetical protein
MLALADGMLALADGMLALADGMLAVGVDVEDSAISIGEQKIYCEKSINYDKAKKQNKKTVDIGGRAINDNTNS